MSERMRKVKQRRRRERTKRRRIREEFMTRDKLLRVIIIDRGRSQMMLEVIQIRISRP